MSNGIQLVGLSGNAGSGKDYIAQHILAPLGFKNFSLAWHFKVWLVGKGLATHEEVFVTKPPHVRKELQLEGTERGRNVYGDDVWNNTAAEWLNLLHEQWGLDKFVIPDVRFPNEVQAIQKSGGKVYRIIAPIRVAASGLSAEARLHISETALADVPDGFFDGYIYNDPGYEELVSNRVYALLQQSKG